LCSTRREIHHFNQNQQQVEDWLVCCYDKLKQSAEEERVLLSAAVDDGKDSVENTAIS